MTSLIGPEHLYDGDVAVYLCGPPPMVESVRTHFADTGVVPTGFYYEKFALSGPARRRRREPGRRRPTRSRRDRGRGAAGHRRARTPTGRR